MRTKIGFRTKFYWKVLKNDKFRWLFPLFEKANLVFFHWDVRERTEHRSHGNGSTILVHSLSES